MTIPRGTAAAAAAIAALCALGAATPSFGQATASAFSSQDTLSDTEIGILGCLPDVTGTLSGTETVAGHIVDTGHSFHVSGTETQSYRIDFTDGRYLTSYSPSHFEFNTNARDRSVFTQDQQDRGTLYAADDSVIGAVTVFTLTHFTFSDGNGNGSPDPGEITTEVSDFRISCP